jgi:cardiolipin-specific phospholipase
MVHSAMKKRFPSESPELLESLSPYLYQITAARGSGEYALNLLLEPGAWARRPLCERLLSLQGSNSNYDTSQITMTCIAFTLSY